MIFKKIWSNLTAKAHYCMESIFSIWYSITEFSFFKRNTKKEESTQTTDATSIKNIGAPSIEICLLERINKQQEEELYKVKNELMATNEQLQKTRNKNIALFRKKSALASASPKSNVQSQPSQAAVAFYQNYLQKISGMRQQQEGLNEIAQRNISKPV